MTIGPVVSLPHLGRVVWDDFEESRMDTQRQRQDVTALVVYESMYGNTHAVAEAIAHGLGPDVVARVVPVEQADAATVGGVDLLVVGGPTHAHGLSRPRTRTAAIEAAAKPDAELEVDPDAEGEGLRDWFDELTSDVHHAAAFDTRMHGPALLTGRASKGIAKRLVAHGATLVVEPESFLVTKQNELLPDEMEHARAWGTTLAGALQAARASA